MNTRTISLLLLFFMMSLPKVFAQEQAENPIIFADVPDLSMVKHGDNYYMSSTTMHMSPGVPIMKSKDLVNWEIVSYAYDTLADIPELRLEAGKNAYGRGSWASSLRFHEGRFYVSTFSGTTGKTYIFSSEDPESGKWEKASFSPSLHDNSLVFDNGKVYMIYGGGSIRIVELESDFSGVKPETDHVLIENASAPAGEDIMLPAEGSQLFKHDGKYYLFHITWPRNGMRTVVIHRADNLLGPYKGKLALQDLGVAQGGLIEGPDGNWFSYLFRDYGAVGRIPYLVPVEWKDGWPVLGKDGKVPEKLELPKSKGLIPGIVASDEFKRENAENSLPLVWQWNHNPENDYWSFKEKPGYLRLTNFRKDTTFLQTRNTLTQRTFGPKSSAEISLELGGLKNGDVAGLGLLQSKYGLVGIRKEKDRLSLISMKGENGKNWTEESIPYNSETVFLKVVCDFENKKDEAQFYFSEDGENWKSIGSILKMEYKLTHFMGYRFALFNYATQETGGFADFDYFRISE